MNNLTVAFAQIIKLAVPYFRSADRWRGGVLLAGVIGIELFLVYLEVRFNQWNNSFYTALQNKDWETFIYQMAVVFSVLAFFFIITSIAQFYLAAWLQIRWRKFLTERYSKMWLGGSAHYRMRLMGNPADNPDQRISEDTRLFVSGLISTGVGLLGAIVTLVSFIFILWGLSAESPLIIGGVSYFIPGYLVWTALIYSGLGTWLTHLIGKPLVRLNFDQQRYEADFRFALVRLRENSEEIALLKGENAEEQGLRGRFANVVSNWFDIMNRQKWLIFFTAGYNQMAIIFPFIVVSPLYFSGAMELGGLMQTAAAFATVRASLSFFVNSYSTLADWKSVVDRLTGFEAALGAAAALAGQGPRFTVDPKRDGELATENLVVALPNGEDIVRVPDLEVAAGEHVLVTGKTGMGKTSLLRALGGVWPFGSGTIVVPAGANAMVLPQRAYLPLGSLRGTLTYPDAEDSIPDDKLVEVMKACGLDHFVERLDEHHHWQNRLSGGEQQRIGIARALLQKPDWLFLDEATSALDEASEAALYHLLVERLPHAAIISVGHRSSLAAHHERFLVIRPAAEGPNLLTAAPAPQVKEAIA